jgi:DNA-binding response OmpR family regulator
VNNRWQFGDDAPHDHELVDGAERDMSQAPLTQRFGDTPVSPSTKTILVVDDDADLRAILKFALEDEGFHFDSADDGLSALRKVRERPPDLVILDLNMPRMGGEQFLYAWRAGVETPGVPVIVVTATSDALRPTDLGVAAVVPKPFDVEQLLACVKDLLALPPNQRGVVRDGSSMTELRDIVENLAQVTSVMLVITEQVASSPDLFDDVRALAERSLDSAHRVSVLVRRLTHLIGPPE